MIKDQLAILSIHTKKLLALLNRSMVPETTTLQKVSLANKMLDILIADLVMLGEITKVEILWPDPLGKRRILHMAKIRTDLLCSVMRRDSIGTTPGRPKGGDYVQ